jgi:glycosyltransferase involved in cell wall biosynthesis
MGRGLPYRFFKAVERYQYSVADFIGVQTPGNLPYLAEWEAGHTGRQTEVLQNWLMQAANTGCSIDIHKDTALAGRKIFVYAGNMGIAQGMGILIELAQRLQSRRDLGFVFVGRGSDAAKLRQDTAELGLDNVAFFDEIEPDEIPGLYAQCDVGLVALDPRHKTHNIPGKFISYMHCGLPTLAIVNNGNDLVQLITQKDVGIVLTNREADSVTSSARELLDRIALDPDMSERCRRLAHEQFSSQAAVRQIVSAISSAAVSHQRTAG